MERLLKENIVFILIVIAVLVGGLYGVFVLGSKTVNSINEGNEKQELLKTKQDMLDNLRRQKAEAEKPKEDKKKESESGKIIYEVLGQQFSAEASFGIMFDNILANMTNSGLRIRSIDYNYSPSNDKIVEANVPGYNACELSFVTVSNYTQLQTFLKNIAKENYLTSISEIYLEAYDKDKTILIARFKIRLYTKTI